MNGRSESPRLLWVDDDGPYRFPYEQMLLDDRGWAVDWAVTVVEGTEKLAAHKYDALVLDQMLPYENGDTPTRWGGCIVLRWLRQVDLPKGVDIEFDYGALVGQEPHSRNSGLKVLIVSAYADEDVQEAITSASVHDAKLRFEPKPLVKEGLLDFIQSFVEADQR